MCRYDKSCLPGRARRAPSWQRGIISRLNFTLPFHTGICSVRSRQDVLTVNEGGVSARSAHPLCFAAMLEFLAAAARAQCVSVLSHRLVCGGKIFDRTVQIKPAIIGFIKAADFIHHPFFAIVQIMRIKRYRASVVFNAAFFRTDDVQF